MIRRTFLILPSVGRDRERTLWRSGIVDWDDFLSASKVPGISEERKVHLDEAVDRADRFLAGGRTEYFSRLLPSVEHWRMYGRFREDAAYLDIETDGCHRHADVTVVGVHRRGGTVSLVRGQDLTRENLGKALEGAKMLVTFNGSSFDLPILEYHFPFTVPRVPHYDLRHACRRAGYQGGLKSVEKQMGIGRAREVEYVTGEEAVYLWRVWERSGRENALRLLQRYNEEDTKNLEPIAERIFEMLKSSLVHGA